MLTHTGFHVYLTLKLTRDLLLFIYLYLWLCWVFVSVRGLSPVAASGGHSSSRCAGLLLSRPLLLQSTGSRRAGSAIGAHGPSCSAARGILPDQGPNPCPLHWQADSQPLRHQGNPKRDLLILLIVSQNLIFSSELFCLKICNHFVTLFKFLYWDHPRTLFKGSIYLNCYTWEMAQEMLIYQHNEIPCSQQKRQCWRQTMWLCTIAF